ncbi:MAG: alpha-amylase family glycosyl hydrolase [Candidatus Amulumruptor caecigallinarius]|nr:alpha-amylase family glycosyl hydrolase [Candidatus Amulumruptor caecigallinarius]MCM1396007.1 alpha-amylase family glycosyl hydrolase [Candidatus Amulumruptor caecigallinarius]MCM1454557.1 alpha-amylase family glycosyl hydrolase [bacterium]
MKKHKQSLRTRLAVMMGLLASCVTGVALAAVNSGDATLSELEMRIDGKNIIQGFTPSRTDYTVELDDASMVTIAAVPKASDATVSITLNGTPMTNLSLANLDGGDNTIIYSVKSGSATKSYTVKVKTPEVLRQNVFDWKNATVYFVITDRFYNGDTSNDNSYHRKRVNGADWATFHGGDLRGLTQKLDYLDKLGINAIWITAPYEQMHGWTGGKNDAFPHYAFHGYYALDWTYMDRNMGTIADMKNFVTEAHKRGIRVVMDIVINHTGYSTLDDCVDYDFGNFNGTPQAGWVPSGNPYSMWAENNAVSFNANSQGKWGNWWSGWVRAFGDRDWGQSAGFAREGGDDKTMSLAGLPDVVTESTSSVAIPPFLKKKWAAETSGDYANYRLPNVDAWRQDNKGAPADYLINWLAGWVEYFGIDGFRCDTAKHVELNRWNQLKQACKQALKNWRTSDRADEYAKTWTDDFWMTGECFGWQHGDTGYFSQGGFDSMINFAFNSSEGSQGRTPTTDDWAYYSNFCNANASNPQVLNYVSSHDTGLHRPGDQKKVADMLLLCPGGAQIYYGDETSRGYMDGCGGDASMTTRSDFNWDAVDNAVNKHWQKVGQFRRRNVAVGAGINTSLGSDTYGRKYDKNGYQNAVVIRLNTSAGQSYTVNVGDHFADGAKVMDGYNTATVATVSGGKVTMPASGSILLIEPYGKISSDPVIVNPPNPSAPVVTASPASGATFDDNITVTLTANPSVAIHYTTDGSTPTASSAVYSSPLTFTSTVTVQTYVANEAGSNVQSFTYTKNDIVTPPTPTGHVVYFDNSSANWGSVYCYAWSQGASDQNAGWPGVQMTKVDGNVYSYKADNAYVNVIFSNGSGDQTGDLSWKDGYIYKKDGSSSQYQGGGDDPTPPTPVDGTVKVYYKGSWNPVNVYIYADGQGDNGSWPGKAMTKESGKDYWSYTVPDNLKNGQVIFNNGSEQYPAAQQPGLQLSGKSMMYDGSNWSEFSEGPQKPTVSISPNGGKVKGTSTITVTIANDATSISASFGGKSLSLNNGSNTVTVSQYLNDGQQGTLSVTAKNDLGEATASASFSRDDTTPVYSGNLTGDWRELSIYQIMVGSFQHGDGGASGYSQMWGPEGHRKNGNLRGIINALDYIKELGMNAIWMTPVFDSSNGGNGDERLKATGYFCNNYFAIDPHFGTEAEFDELVSKAHEKGIYIILDGVFGHHSNATGASPGGKYIDNRTASNVRGNDAGNIAFPGSLDYFKEVIRYWMNRGVDGWRLDQCYQVYQGGHNYWKDLREECERVAAERKSRGEKWGTLGYMVGEDWTSAGNITVTQQDGLKSVMDFDGKDNIVNLSSGVGSIGWFLSNDSQSRGYRDSGVNATLFLSNHDTSRVGDFVDVNSRPKELMTRHAAVAAYSGPTCTYYGDEIGDKSGNSEPDNKARTSGRLSGFNSNEQMVHDFVAKCFKARGENPALWRGSVQRQQQGNNVEIITKTDSQTGNKVVCIFTSENATVNIGGTGEDLLNGGSVSGNVSVEAWVPKFIRMN